MRANDPADAQQTTNETPEAEHVEIFNIRQLAKEFIIVGIKGKLLRVRRKSDGAELWLTVPIHG